MVAILNFSVAHTFFHENVPWRIFFTKFDDSITRIQEKWRPTWTWEGQAPFSKKSFLREYFHKMLCLHHCLNDLQNEHLTEIATILKKWPPCWIFGWPTPLSQNVTLSICAKCHACIQFERFSWNMPLSCCTIAEITGAWLAKVDGGKSIITPDLM